MPIGNSPQKNIVFPEFSKFQKFRKFLKFRGIPENSCSLPEIRICPIITICRQNSSKSAEFRNPPGPPAPPPTPGPPRARVHRAEWAGLLRSRALFQAGTETVSVGVSRTGMFMCLHGYKWGKNEFLRSEGAVLLLSDTDGETPSFSRSQVVFFAQDKKLRFRIAQRSQIL